MDDSKAHTGSKLYQCRSKKYRYIYFVTLCEILVFDTEHDECAGIDIADGRKLDGLGEKARKIVEDGEKR